MVTKGIGFSGRELVLNYSTSAAGNVRAEVQSLEGNTAPNYGLHDCRPLVGDEIEGIVHWHHGADLTSLRVKPVRLRFVLQDADLYSLQFR